MLTDLEARVVLKELIEKYLKGKDSEYDRVMELFGILRGRFRSGAYSWTLGGTTRFSTRSRS